MSCPFWKRDEFQLGENKRGFGLGLHSPYLHFYPSGRRKRIENSREWESGHGRHMDSCESTHGQ